MVPLVCSLISALFETSLMDSNKNGTLYNKVDKGDNYEVCLLKCLELKNKRHRLSNDQSQNLNQILLASYSFTVPILMWK